MTLTREVFLDVVQELGLPVPAQPLASDLDQPVRWRSVHRAQLIATLQKRCDARPDIKAVFAATTAAEILRVYEVNES